MTRTWVEEMIEKGILETEKTKNLPGYFGRKTISLGDIKNVLKEDDEDRDELYQENGEDGYEWF